MVRGAVKDVDVIGGMGKENCTFISGPSDASGQKCVKMPDEGANLADMDSIKG